jgi:hypothetical protein
VTVVTSVQEEAVERERHLVRCDARARVLHREFACSRGQRDRAAGWSAAQGVLDEVRHRLQQPVAIGQGWSWVKLLDL